MILIPDKEGFTIPRAMVVNLRKHPDAVKNGAIRIDRKTKWGNPFKLADTKESTRREAIEKYRFHLFDHIRCGAVTLQELAALHGNTLACWCVPKLCHGHVLAEVAEWAAYGLYLRDRKVLQAENGSTLLNPDADSSRRPMFDSYRLSFQDICPAGQAPTHFKYPSVEVLDRKGVSVGYLFKTVRGIWQSPPELTKNCRGPEHAIQFPTLENAKKHLQNFYEESNG